MPSSKSAKDFFRPLAVGAPTPPTEIPARPSRAIHFFDPSNEKMAAKIPQMVGSVDVLLGNLEDAVKAKMAEGLAEADARAQAAMMAELEEMEDAKRDEAVKADAAKQASKAAAE